MDNGSPGASRDYSDSQPQLSDGYNQRNLGETALHRTGSSGSLKSPDRYIPQRQPRRWRCAYGPYPSAVSANVHYETPPPGAFMPRPASYTEQACENKALYQRLLDSELMGADMPDQMEEISNLENGGHFRRALSPGRPFGGRSANTTLVTDPTKSDTVKSTSGAPNTLTVPTVAITSSKRNVFTYAFKSSDRKKSTPSPLSLSPLSEKSSNMLDHFWRFGRNLRKIPTRPLRVLDVPGIYDDFYLNLLDWSSTNVLAVGLGHAVYLWNADPNQLSQKSRLCSLSGERNAVCSVKWTDSGERLAIGTHTGHIIIWDIESQRSLTTTKNHTARVGSLAWNGDVLASGSRDRTIFFKDIREPPVYANRQCAAHTQEVCGLKWSPDYTYLASGGNDNKVHLWSHRADATTPIQTYKDHSAAIKAMAWSPHQHGVLATGGGTSDRCIRFWNTLTGEAIGAVDTNSQICNLAWSSHSSELVSTHGFQENEVLVWSYPSMTQIAKLVGHKARVLYMGTAPDHETIATGAGDESLIFWRVFPHARAARGRRSSLDLLNAFR